MNSARSARSGREPYRTFPLAWESRVTLRTMTMFRISSESWKAKGMMSLAS